MRIHRFGHAGIEVGDLKAAEAFYRGLFGFEVAARYPEDGEVMLAVGAGDHLLLHSGEADRNSPASPSSSGLNHAAFELVEGHREIDTVRRRLSELGVDFESVDHEGDASVYFRDPDGNLLELYVAPGSTPRFGSADARLEAARRFVYANARTIDRAIFEHVHEGAPAHRVRASLETYRNPDGGFGHALEPDVRAPDSQPIHTLTALELLREAGIRAPDVADRCCEFFGSVATDEAALPALLTGALDYPAAGHWQGPSAMEPSLAWTFGIVAQLTWHGAHDAWFEKARQACLDAFAAESSQEAHHLLYLVRFASDVLDGEHRERALRRHCGALSRAEWFVAETPVSRYGLTPLHCAPAPAAPCRACFDDTLIDAHLDDLLDSQQGDGGWPIRFNPPSEAAMLEWRGRWTLEALAVLRAYRRL
jgi:catechol 2,3-dioxygenase-like lactoylglutathione lyase family enzyme